jgi:hypothetical protein
MAITIDPSQRLELIKNFNHTQIIPHDEIIFHLQRGESLHIRSTTGEWLKSFSWNGDRPTCYNWVTKTNESCSVSDIPYLGEQVIGLETVNVCFYKIGDLPIWRNPVPAVSSMELQS